MKKISRSDLKGLTEKFLVLTSDQQQSVVGGTTKEEFDNWTGIWTGGYVDGLGWVGPEATVYGSYSSSSSNSSSSSTNYYWWGMVETNSYDQQGAYDYAHSLDLQNIIAGGIAGIIVSFSKWPVGVAFSIGNMVISYYDCEKIYQAATTGGITVTTSTYYGYMSSSDPYAGKYTTVTDKNGNKIVTF